MYRRRTGRVAAGTAGDIESLPVGGELRELPGRRRSLRDFEFLRPLEQRAAGMPGGGLLLHDGQLPSEKQPSCSGAGVDASTLSNCLCINNWANYAGGGAVWSTLYNCTVVSNTVPTDPGTFGGGGVYDGPIYNSIVYDNNGGNYGTDFGITLSYCCTTPDPGGIGNITNDPGLCESG